MKKFTVSILAFVMSFSLYAQPPSFSWGAEPSEDQKVPGPCHIFASVSAVETWYKMLYGGSPVQISQSHLYSQCAGNNGPSTDIDSSLKFFKNYGVVDTFFMPYNNFISNPCQNGAYINGLNSNMSPNLIDCGTPWKNCTPFTSLPSVRYRIAGYEEVNIASYVNNNQLKRAIMNYGPIALWFATPSLYNNDLKIL
jgi:hypothetical protein